MRYGFMGTGTRIIVLLLLILVLFVFGVIWFDFLDLIDSKELISPVMELLGLKEKTGLVDIEDPLLLDKERLKMQLEALTLRSEELNQREEELNQREADLNQMIEDMAEREKSYEKKEKSFNERLNEIENRRENIWQISKYLVGMRPENARDILLNMENDMDIIDILRMTEEIAQEAGEESIVAYWLSLMPPERSAELSRKMAKKPIE